MYHQRVAVYFNLHKRLFSVRALQGANRGRVVAHVDSFTIRNAEFRVQPGGRDRVRRTGVKDIHAFVVGEIVPHVASDAPGFAPVTYNPMRDDSFVWRKSRDACHTARHARGVVVDRVPRVDARM